MTARAERAGASDELARAEADVERARARVAFSVLALRREVSRQSDWRLWLARHPLAVLAGALAVRYWLGRRGR